MGRSAGPAVVVPPAFAEWTIAREGAAGRAWIERLPTLVEAACRRWALTVDGPPTHGNVALVVPVRAADGTAAILKVSWVEDETEHEALALRSWGGAGAVQLLATDRAPWLAIDPKPVSGDPGFDVVPLFWNRWEELVATGDVAAAVRRRFDVAVDVAGIDRERARRWSITGPSTTSCGPASPTAPTGQRCSAPSPRPSPHPSPSPTRDRRPARPGR